MLEAGGRIANPLDRRRFLAGLAAAAVSLSRGTPAVAAHPGVSIGAIRWDAWYIGSDRGAIRSSVAAALAPPQYRGRAPACATVSGGSMAFDRCGTQTQIDREILAASAAKLDYWAYCWYGADHPMQQAWRLHQASRLAGRIRWCALFSSYRQFVSEAASAPAALLRRPNYQVVGAGRPLVYILGGGAAQAGMAGAVRGFRAAATAAGLADPYIVLLTSTLAEAQAQGEGVDAFGIYAKGSPTPAGGRYADLVALAEGYWATLAASGRAMVPTAMTGWDRRPRIARPVPWEASYQQPGAGADRYFAAGTPGEIAAHVADMVRWIGAHPAACPARTGLIYSWDEYDEGGSTLAPAVAGGGKILAAVGRVL